MASATLCSLTVMSESVTCVLTRTMQQHWILKIQSVCDSGDQSVLMQLLVQCYDVILEKLAFSISQQIFFPETKKLYILDLCYLQFIITWE